MDFKRLFRYSFLIGVGQLVGCANPLEDFKLTFKEPITQGLYTFTIRDYANRQVIPTDLKITGKEADRVVNNLNDPKFVFSEEGQIRLAIERSIEPTPSEPFSFLATFSAEGFLPQSYRIRATNRANRGFTARLASLTTRTQGVLGMQATPNAQGITTFADPEGLPWVRWTGAVSPQGLNPWGEPVQGNIRWRLQHFNRTSKNVLPGQTIGRLYDPTGKELPDAHVFQGTAGFIYTQWVTETEEIAKLATPLAVQMWLENQVNPLTGKEIQKGEMLPLYQYNPFTGRWTKQADVVAEQEATGRLFVRFAMQEGSYWIVGWTTAVCNTATTFRIQSLLKDVDINYFCQYVRESDGQVVRNFFASMNNGSSFSTQFLPRETGKVRLFIYLSTDFHGGDRTTPVYKSEPVDVCVSQVVPLNLDLILPFPPSVNVFFNVRCPEGKTLDETLLPAQMRSQFSEPGKNQWRDLAVFTRSSRSIRTYRLKTGATYDFRASTDGGVTWPYKQENYKIVASYYGLTLQADGYCK